MSYQKQLLENVQLQKDRSCFKARCIDNQLVQTKMQKLSFQLSKEISLKNNATIRNKLIRVL